MSEIRKDSAGFAGCDYKEIAAGGGRAAFCLDCYESFGWVPDGRAQAAVPAAKGKLMLKRDRKIMNKAELTRLQRHFEACMEEISALERSKTSIATIWALVVGLIGTVFMALAAFAAVHEPPLWGLMAVLAAPGLIGWALPYFLYQRLAAKRAKVVAELVEQKYDEIYEICRQGNKLLN